MGHERVDDVLGNVHQFPHVDASLDTHSLEHSHEDLEWCIPGAGTHPSHGPVDPRRARLDGSERVRNAHVEVVVSVKPNFDIVVQPFPE